MGRSRSRVGGYGASHIGRLAQNDPAAAEAEILEAIDRSRGRMVSAAVELGIDRRHLQRLCWTLDIWPKVDAIRDRWSDARANPHQHLLASTRVDSAAAP